MKRSTIATLVVTALALFVLACGLGGGGDDDDNGDDVARPVTVTGTGSVSATPAATTGALAPADFTLTIKTLSKQCFGSAGCHVTYRVVPKYSFRVPLDNSKTYRVIYEVLGGDSGPAVNSFQMTGKEYSVQGEEVISTKSTSVVLKGRVTEVLEEGL